MANETQCPSGFTAIGDLLLEPPAETPFLVDRLLPAGGLSLLLGKPKAGKSTLARCLCMAVATGGRWLERQCAVGPVLYMALEEIRGEVRRHFAALGAQADHPIHAFIDRIPVGADPAQWLRPAITHYEPALVVIDPLARFVRMRDGNDYMDVTSKLEPLISLARESEAQTHIAFVHHSRKAPGQHGDESLGSTAILGSVDTAISLTRDSAGPDRMIYSTNRYGEDLPATIVTLDQESGWVNLGATKLRAAMERIADRILDFVKGHPGPVRHDELLAKCVGRTEAKQRAIQALVIEGQLIRAGAGRRNDPYRYSFPVS